MLKQEAWCARRELLHVIPKAKRPRVAVGADFMSVRSPERANVVLSK